ncbi:hypothetical protein E4U30_000957 [Claviceps sp. LM220 group G6]|nr:hypothetical protein E4U30_000957 [Claviceps sp. LM220 group G6]
MALNFTIRDAAATRGYASETDFDTYSKALLELATERELLPAFRTTKSSWTFAVDVEVRLRGVSASGGGVPDGEVQSHFKLAHEQGKWLGWALSDTVNPLKGTRGDVLRKESGLEDFNEVKDDERDERGAVVRAVRNLPERINAHRTCSRGKQPRL